MAVTVPPTADVFTRIGRWVEGRCADERLCTHTGACPEPPLVVCVSLDELRAVISGSDVGSPVRLALWRHIARRVHAESAEVGERRWELIALWLLTPRLEGGARAVARRTGAETADACSAMLSGVLGALRTVGTTEPAAVEEYLMSAAFHAVWRTGRRDPRAVPVEEWDRVSGDSCDPRDPFPGHADAADHAGCGGGGGLVHVGPMSQALFQRVHGERLGSLAHRLGLLPHVREVRRLRRARPRPGAGGSRPGAAQPLLFDVPEASDAFAVGEAGDDTAA